MNTLTFTQAMVLGFKQPFSLSMLCITIIYILWMMGLSLEEQDSPRSVKTLLFANLASRTIQFYPHELIVRRSLLFISVFLASFIISTLSIGSLLLVLRGFFFGPCCYFFNNIRSK